jgi:hypothetical protein
MAIALHVLNSLDTKHVSPTGLVVRTGSQQFAGVRAAWLPIWLPKGDQSRFKRVMELTEIPDGSRG